MRSECGKDVHKVSLESYDGEHQTAKYSVSTGVEIENFMRMKTKKKNIEFYHNGYFITKFAFKKEKRASRAINN